MTLPQLCTALRQVIASWHEYQAAIGESDARGELTVDELVARQNYDTALAQFERANHPHQEAAA